MTPRTPTERLAARAAIAGTIGPGLCHALLPGRIEVDEWGFPVLRDASVSAADEVAVRRAVAACPSRALSLTSTSSR